MIVNGFLVADRHDKPLSVRLSKGMMETLLETKKKHLAEQLRSYDRLAVALSGGVDSALLLAEAASVLGRNLIALTARSPIHPQQEIDDAARIATWLGVDHRIIDTDEMSLEAFRANTPERCYICKKHVFGRLLDHVRQLGFDHLAHGANADDLDDFRPGLQAAHELGIVAPLMDAGLTKAQIREMARQRGLHVWDKPAMACLATRFPYQTSISKAKVEMVHQAEIVLVNAGFSGSRVRHHGDVARIEVPLALLPTLVADPMRQKIAKALRHIGFMHVCADLEGYVTGSLNRAVNRGTDLETGAASRPLPSRPEPDERTP